MGQPELATDERFATHGARGDNMTELDELVGAWTSALPCEKLLAVLDEHGVPAGRIFTAPDMLTDPQYVARDMVRRVTSTQGWDVPMTGVRSEEHTSELQSLMRISYAVFCLKKKKQTKIHIHTTKHVHTK